MKSKKSASNIAIGLVAMALMGSGNASVFAASDKAEDTSSEVRLAVSGPGHIFDLSKKKHFRLKSPYEKLSSSCISPDGKKVAALASYDRLLVYSVKGTLEQDIKIKYNRFTDLYWPQHDPNYLYLLSRNYYDKSSTIVRFDLQSKQMRALYRTPPGINIDRVITTQSADYAILSESMAGSKNASRKLVLMDRAGTIIGTIEGVDAYRAFWYADGKRLGLQYMDTKYAERDKRRDSVYEYDINSKKQKKVMDIYWGRDWSNGTMRTTNDDKYYVAWQSQERFGEMDLMQIEIANPNNRRSLWSIKDRSDNAAAYTTGGLNWYERTSN